VKNAGCRAAAQLARSSSCRNLGLDLGLNFTRNRNRLVDLQGAEFQFLPGGFSNSAAVRGAAARARSSSPTSRAAAMACPTPTTSRRASSTSTAVCRAAGAPDGALYVGANGFPIVDPQNRVAGDPNPDWQAGIRLGARLYKRITLSTLVDVRRGGDVWNGTRAALQSYGTSKFTENRATCTGTGANQSCTGNEQVFGRGGWYDGPVVGPGAGKAVPIGENWFRAPSAAGPGIGNNFNGPQAQFVEDGGFTRIREVSVAYTIDGARLRSVLGMSSVDLRLAGRNLFLWTDYQGIDPETNLQGPIGAGRGQDYFNNPQTRSWVINVTLTPLTGAPSMRLPRTHHAARRALAAAAAVLAAGCTDFNAPELTTNPNQPSTATANQLLTGITSFAAAGITGDFNRAITVWMQQMAGTGRQWINIDAPYAIDENTLGGYDTFYTGGGLIDIRELQNQARAANDQVYLGIAQVWEVLVMSHVTDWWGDVPYREAVDLRFRTPALDPQQQVYADLQAKLDSAITNLAGGGAGPGAIDLIYGGDKAKWTRLARTLKARLYLHVAERDPAAYALALAQANQGISEPTGAGDFRTYHSTTVGEENQWFQFRRGRGTDISAGKFLVDLMRTRNGGAADPRLAQYFGSAGGGAIAGAAPGEEGESFSWLSADRASGGFRQPLVTWAENQLIKAEALVRANDLVGATRELNLERQQAGLAPVAAGLTREQLYRAIMEEKYVALFQNPEVWSDWKRTCLPNIPVPNGAPAIPARLVYGSNERATNSNIPSPNAAPRRNWNDPAQATAADGTACLSQPS
jgi:hypothetical protein